MTAWLVLAALGGVTALPSRAQQSPPPPNDSAFDLQWAHPLLGVQKAWETGRGEGATVAVLDTGVDFSHDDLRGQLLTGRNFVRRDRSANDDNGQGTHLAGIVAAKANNSMGVAGIAPQARILPVKVLDSEDEGTERNVLDGIAYAIERKASVLLLELDRDIELSDGGATFRKAIEAAFAAGVLPVLAAEHPYLLSTEFANAPALVVAGLTRDGKQPTYDHADGVGRAEWGLAAPSGSGDGSENDILSTMWPHTRQVVGEPRQEFGRYAYDGDNAQAAAHAAGAAAILRGLGQSPRQTVDRLLRSARDAGPNGPDGQFGSGVLAIDASTAGLAPAPPDRGPSTTSPAVGAGGGSSSPPSLAETGEPSSPGPGIAEPQVAGAQVDNPMPETDPGGAPEGPGGEVAVAEESSVPSRSPVVPIVVFLLLFGAATITWALRRRTPPGLPGADAP